MRDRYTLAALVLLVLLTLIIITPGTFALHDPNTPDVAVNLHPPSLVHPFGTDDLGRDIYSRVIYGVRISALSAVGVVALTSLVGALVGMVAGYFRRGLGELLMHVADMFIAFPTLVAAMVLVVVLGPSLKNAMIAIALVWWPQYARLMRGLVLQEEAREYVSAARALRVRDESILLLPEHIVAYGARCYAAEVLEFPMGIARQVALLADLARRHGVAGGRIGIEVDFMQVEYFDALRAALPGAKLVSALPCIEETVSVKFPEEVDVLREAARLVDVGVGAILSGAREGMTELQLAGLAAAALTGGAETFNHLCVRTGENACELCPINTERVIRKGDPIQLDIGYIYRGYVSDINRTLVLGGASADQARVIRTVVQMGRETIKALRPGARAAGPARNRRAWARSAGQGIGRHAGEVRSRSYPWRWVPCLFRSRRRRPACWSGRSVPPWRPSIPTARLRSPTSGTSSTATASSSPPPTTARSTAISSATPASCSAASTRTILTTT